MYIYEYIQVQSVTAQRGKRVMLVTEAELRGRTKAQYMELELSIIGVL